MRHLTEMLVSRGLPSEERRAHYYQLLATETERLHRMVESLLSFGRIEAGAYAWKLEQFDPGELVRELLGEFRQDAQWKSREFSCDVDADLPPIRADREALSRALWNLLENAAKYSQESAGIRVFARRSGEFIRIGVEDRGNGIPAEERAAIFQKFIRGAGAKREGVRGVGIGLALVRRIAEAHGGSVELASEVGRGSTFTLVLPCHAS
jgi:signal transduction histidine kinase